MENCKLKWTGIANNNARLIYKYHNEFSFNLVKK